MISKVIAFNFADIQIPRLNALFAEKIDIQSVTAKDEALAIVVYKDKPYALFFNLENYPIPEYYQNLKHYAIEQRIPIVFFGEEYTPDTFEKAVDLGADDYLTYDMSPRICQVRIKAKYRQLNTYFPDSILQAGMFVLNRQKHQVLIKGETIDLTGKEYKIVEMLIKNMGHTISREKLGTQLGLVNSKQGLRVVDVHVANIRKKLRPYGAYMLETIRGRGYRIKKTDVQKAV
jgi:DNA-binding response OmpR family regulator